ncbi:MAG: hypothetical protein AB7O67_06450 [Vicinamibacterales bacterium]
MTRFLGLAFALAVGIAPAAHGQETSRHHAQHDAVAPDISGVWALTLMSHQVGLELEQDGGTLKGRLLIMGQYVPVTGAFSGETFTLTGDAKVGHRSDANAVPLELTGHLEEDGTLAGEVATSDGPQAWTGERLPKP